MLIAVSIENKLYQTASSPRAYCALSTLEFRITALATAVLIHSDKDRDHNHQGISETCARLSAAARRSLVYCVMVLVSYETRTGSRMARKNEGYLQQYQGKSSSSKRMAEDGYSQRAKAEYHLRQPEKCTSSKVNFNCATDYRQFENTTGGMDQSGEDSNQLKPFPPSA